MRCGLASSYRFHFSPRCIPPFLLSLLLSLSPVSPFSLCPSPPLFQSLFFPPQLPLATYLSLSVCPSVCLSVCLPLFVSICLCLSLSVCLSLSLLSLSVCLSACLSVCLSLSLSVCLSICVRAYLLPSCSPTTTTAWMCSTVSELLGFQRVLQLERRDSRQWLLGRPR